jgi:Gpi18-like mannosyltransferase
MQSQNDSRHANPRRGYSLALPLCLVLFARIILSGLGLILLIARKVPLSEEGAIRPYYGITPITQGLSGALLGVWQRFDAIHYLRIASTGYSATDLSTYFPLYPFMIRVLGTLLGRNYLLASLVISNIAAVFAVLLFYLLVIDEFDDQELAKRAITYLVFFPTGFFLLAPYTESVAFLFSILAFREAKHGRWLIAGVAGLACSLARAQGVLISLLLAAEAARQYRHG